MCEYVCVCARALFFESLTLTAKGEQTRTNMCTLSLIVNQKQDHQTSTSMSLCPLSLMLIMRDA